MRCWRLFGKAQDGLAAVEFALILPVLITLFFGTVELSMALVCRADVSTMVSAASDLIAQESTTQTSDISNVYNAAATVMYPYYTGGTTGKPTIRITSIIYDTTTNSTTSGKIAWTCEQAGSGTLTPATRSPGSTVSLSQALLVANGSVIMAEVAYNYTSPTTQVVTGPINMSNVWYTKPRRVAQIPSPTGGCP
jgi:Flp pilus assembly protein TadG